MSRLADQDTIHVTRRWRTTSTFTSVGQSKNDAEAAHPGADASSPGLLHHIQVKRAFLDDQEHPARVALLGEVTGSALEIVYLDSGDSDVVEVANASRLAEILARDDLCRVRERPLLLVNTHYRVLGIATGPAGPPPQLEVLIVSRLEDGDVVELVTDSDVQPSWQLLALEAA